MCKKPDSARSTIRALDLSRSVSRSSFTSPRLQLIVLQVVNVISEIGYHKDGVRESSERNSMFQISDMKIVRCVHLLKTSWMAYGSLRNGEMYLHCD